MSDSAIIALEKAIQFESDGHDYYQRLADEMNDPAVKGLFALLAEDEKDHIARVREIYEELKDKPGWPSVDSMIARQSGSYDAFELASQKCAGIGCDAGVTQAIDKAITMEEAGIAFYSQRLDQATCDAEAKFFTALVEEEKRHLEILQKSKGEVFA
jgi:rubrerythrin